jgi:hypothetical protein
VTEQVAGIYNHNARADFADVAWMIITKFRLHESWDIFIGLKMVKLVLSRRNTKVILC